MRCSSWPAGNRTCPCSTSKELAEEALLVRLGEAHRAFFAHQPRNGVVVGLSGRRFHVEDHGFSLVGGVEYVAGLGVDTDGLQAEHFLDFGEIGRANDCTYVPK